MGKKETKYTEITSAQVSENRSIVISDCSRGGFTMAQRIEVKEGDYTNKIFLKGAFHINDVHGLYNLRDACNLAIKKIEEREAEDEDWD